jgi:hypothetical protein
MLRVRLFEVGGSDEPNCADTPPLCVPVASPSSADTPIFRHALNPAIVPSHRAETHPSSSTLASSRPSAHLLPRRFLLAKFNSPSNIIRAKLPPPLLTSLPHDPRTLDIKLSRPQEPQQMLVGESVVSRSRGNPLVRRVRRDQVLRFQERAELSEGLLLCGITVNNKSIGDQRVLLRFHRETYRCPG